MIKAVIFDLDGTLLYSLEDLGNSTNAALQAFGFRGRSLEEVRQFVGNGVAQLIHRSLPARTSAETEDKCLAYFRQYYKEHMYDHTRPYEGVKEMLKELRQSGMKTGILSNKFQAAVSELQKRYFKEEIDDVQGEQAGIACKPDPAGMLLLLERMSVLPEETIYLGDSPEDAETADHAGVGFIGVTWGYRSLVQLQEAGMKYWIDTPGQLLSVIRQNF